MNRYERFRNAIYMLRLLRWRRVCYLRRDNVFPFVYNETVKFSVCTQNITDRFHSCLLPRPCMNSIPIGPNHRGGERNAAINQISPTQGRSRIVSSYPTEGSIVSSRTYIHRNANNKHSSTITNLNKTIRTHRTTPKHQPLSTPQLRATHKAKPQGQEKDEKSKRRKNKRQ